MILIDIFSAMVMADVTVITDLMHEEEKRIKTFLEGLGDKLKHKGVRLSHLHKDLWIYSH